MINFVILKHIYQNDLLHHIPVHHKAAHSYLAHSKWNNVVIWTNAAIPKMLLLIGFIKFADLL